MDLLLFIKWCEPKITNSVVIYLLNGSKECRNSNIMIQIKKIDFPLSFQDVAMLLKVKSNSIKKYIKLHSGFTYSEFIREGKSFEGKTKYVANLTTNHSTILSVAELFKYFWLYLTVYITCCAIIFYFNDRS